VRHAVDHFVDGSIAAEDQNQVGSVGDRLTSQFGGVARGASRQRLRMQTRTGQSFSGTV